MAKETPTLLCLTLFILSCLCISSSRANTTILQQTLDALHIGGAQSVPPPASLEIAFSPDGGAENLVIKTIQSAKQSIRVAAYSFTSHPIHALQHDKYMVIDDKTVETGSFNYTAAAEHYNSENVVVLRDAPQL